jgi:hypothetical protein
VALGPVHGDTKTDKSRRTLGLPQMALEALRALKERQITERLPSLINVEWQLRGVSGRFCRLRPKDDSYRSTNVEPLTPVDVPPFLAGLLAAQAGRHARQRCACAAGHGGSGRYVFLGPDGGHHRNSNYARRIFRPACGGRHPPASGSPGKLVIADATAWPGTPAAAWPPAVPGKPFAPPSGRGTQRLTSTADTGRCPSCGHAVRLRLDGRIIAHNNQPGPCPGSGEQPAGDAPLACWLPVKDALTPHGLRHGHKTWMAEDGIPVILAEQRLGHQVRACAACTPAPAGPVGGSPSGAAPPSTRTPRSRCSTTGWRRSGPRPPVTPVQRHD